MTKFVTVIEFEFLSDFGRKDDFAEIFSQLCNFCDYHDHVDLSLAVIEIHCD